MQYLSYSTCQCGAITIETDQGTYTCLMKNRHVFFQNLDLRKIPKTMSSYLCNHCVNHWGLDLCGCGSGEPYGHCPNMEPECQIPMQKIGSYDHVQSSGAWSI